MDLPSCLSTSTGLFKERVPQDWGTQRARFRVDAAAELVFAELPWRRHERPSVGSGIVAVGPGGGRIERAGIVNSSTEAGVVAFSATRATLVDNGSNTKPVYIEDKDRRGKKAARNVFRQLVSQKVPTAAHFSVDVTEIFELRRI